MVVFRELDFMSRFAACYGDKLAMVPNAGIGVLCWMVLRGFVGTALI